MNGGLYGIFSALLLSLSLTYVRDFDNLFSFLVFITWYSRVFEFFEVGKCKMGFTENYIKHSQNEHIS